MNWEQKLVALQCICPTWLCMRRPGDWFVEARGRDVMEGEGGMFLCGSYGNGRTPEEAVNNDWEVIAVPGHAIRVHDKYWRWGGFMWQQMTREQAVFYVRIPGGIGGGK